MSDQKIQYLTQDSLDKMQVEYTSLKNEKIPEIAKRIDEAKQQGDLSENAEYHQAREDMSWAQGHLKELEQIIQNAQIIQSTGSNKVELGDTITVEANGQKREYTIVGAQEADPANGLISNESPLGESFLGLKKGEKVSVRVPAGEQEYEILEIK